MKHFLLGLLQILLLPVLFIVCFISLIQHAGGEEGFPLIDKFFKICGMK